MAFSRSCAISFRSASTNGCTTRCGSACDESVMPPPGVCVRVIADRSTGGGGVVDRAVGADGVAGGDVPGREPPAAEVAAEPGCGTPFCGGGDGGISGRTVEDAE